PKSPFDVTIGCIIKKRREFLRMAQTAQTSIVGVGFYTTAEASRLLGVPVRNIRRWLLGYSYMRGEKRFDIDPLWVADLPKYENQIEVSFRDLIELRFVNAFLSAGLGLKTIRNCLNYAQGYINDTHPFSTNRFRTDGRTIFLESASEAGGDVLLD